MALTLANCRELLDAVVQRAGNSGTYTNTEKDMALQTALDWANVEGWLRRETTDLTINKNDRVVDFSGVTNWDASQFVDARISKTQATLNTSGGTNWTQTADAGASNEYYYRSSASADPGLIEPDIVWRSDAIATKGTVGSLSASEWGWGDSASDALGYDTVYIHNSGVDPDSSATGLWEYSYLRHQVSLRDADDIRALYKDEGDGLERPRYIGFDTDPTAQVWPAADSLYALRVRYRAPITDFDIGTGSAVTFDVPESHLRPIIVWGASAIMMLGDPTVYTQSGEWAQFEKWVAKIKGAGVDPGPTVKVPAD